MGDFMTKKMFLLVSTSFFALSTQGEPHCSAYCVKGGPSVQASPQVTKLSTRFADEMFLKCKGEGARLVHLTEPGAETYKFATAQNSCDDAEIDPLIAAEEEFQDSETPEETLTQEALNAQLEKSKSENKETL
jgi:hypothetical protein